MDRIELENAWREYRINAANGSWLGRMIDLKSAYGLSASGTIGEFLKEQGGGDTTLRVPSPGSSYWCECIDVPDFFRAMVDYSDFDPVEALQQAKKMRKVTRQIKGKRLRAGRVVISLREI